MHSPPLAEPSTACGVAAAYAAHLLRSLGLGNAAPSLADEHPALTWACSGLMHLTGRPDGPPLLCPTVLPGCADGALAALAALAPPGALDGLRGSALLAERAAVMGLRRQGDVSPGGACRLYPCADGGIALNLARAGDWELLPALFEIDEVPSAEVLPQLVRARRVDDLVERGRLLGLAIAADRAPEGEAPPWFAVAVEGGRLPPPARPPRVLDLSSLWAGPLCTHLLQRLGAEVIKLESPRRADGARAGSAAFFDLLNAGKQSVAIDPAEPGGLRQWRALIDAADIVVEGSRPRALRQLGIDAEALVRARPGLCWISLSGYGRGAPREHWIAYGDDAAVGAGLSDLMRQASGERLICGDAIADPLTGLHAALAAWAFHRSGRGGLIALALHDVVAHALRFDPPPAGAALRRRNDDWTARARAAGVGAPRARAAAGQARALGADTAAVLARLGIAC